MTLKTDGLLELLTEGLTMVTSFKTAAQYVYQPVLLTSKILRSLLKLFVEVREKVLPESTSSQSLVFADFDDSGKKADGSLLVRKWYAVIKP
jgi:hypothetical protein